MVEIKLGWPDRALFPNRRGGRHWGSFQRQKESARHEGYMAAKQVLHGGSIASCGALPVAITFYQPDRRKRDIDGMLGAIKHHLDGIAKALGVDDYQFRPLTLNACYDRNKEGYVLVEVG